MDAEDETPPATNISEMSPVEAASIRVIRSDEIFQGDREVRIQHEDSVYRLRLTRKGKLILHK